MPTPRGYGAIALTGGGTGALDAHDGAPLNDQDIALVGQESDMLFRAYLLDATSGVAESSPGVISPDTNAGDKRWELLGIHAASAQIGDDSNYSAIATDGELTQFGTARTMKNVDIEIVIPAKGTGTYNAPADAVINDFNLLRFDRSTEESILWHWEIPHDYAAAGLIHLHVEFVVENPPSGAGDEVVRWEVEYKKLSIGDVFDFSSGTSVSPVNVTLTDGETAFKIHQSGSMALTTSGWAAMDIILMRLYRDSTNVADTFDSEGPAANNDAWLFNMHMEYLSDRLGEAT